MKRFMVKIFSVLFALQPALVFCKAPAYAPVPEQDIQIKNESGMKLTYELITLEEFSSNPKELSRVPIEHAKRVAIDETISGEFDPTDDVLLIIFRRLEEGPVVDSLTKKTWKVPPYVPLRIFHIAPGKKRHLTLSSPYELTPTPRTRGNIKAKGVSTRWDLLKKYDWKTFYAHEDMYDTWSF